MIFFVASGCIRARVPSAQPLVVTVVAQKSALDASLANFEDTFIIIIIILRNNYFPQRL